LELASKIHVEVAFFVCYCAGGREGNHHSSSKRGLKLRVLVVGGGGREHALVWKLASSPRVQKIYAAPGNAGIAAEAECVDIAPTDMNGLLEFALAQRIDLTVVGPEVPLTLGIVDLFSQKGFPIFGPSEKAAMLEGSKVFAKELMVRAGIPTAPFAVFDDVKAAEAYIKKRGAPIVVKADGLAAGKGAIVAGNVSEALHAAEDMLVRGRFGKAGKRVVIEDCLVGEEASVLAFTDGQSVLMMIASQDHKQIYDGDTGPNTGGMGAYAPAPVAGGTMLDEILEKVMKPAVKEMADLGRPYVGVLYAGLMIDKEAFNVVEFNCRFGDPEAQALLPLLDTDLFELMERTIASDLEGAEIEWQDRHAVCVVVASGGYPEKYEKGKIIAGLDAVSRMKNVAVFHAGTALENGRVVTNGGRVLGVTGLGKTLEESMDTAYEGIRRIDFESMYYRKDIGAKGLNRYRGD
jgi:phosphoribosylamine--glycine ligase